METLYEDVRDIDLFVGILGEKKDEHDAILGPVGRCVVADTFYKNMLGDHHFYDNAGHPGFDPFTEGKAHIRLQKVKRCSNKAFIFNAKVNTFCANERPHQIKLI